MSMKVAPTQGGGYKDKQNNKEETELSGPEKELANALERFRGPKGEDDPEEEQLQDTKKKPTVDRVWFNCLVGLVVLINMIYIGLEQDYGVKFTDQELLELSAMELVNRRFMWYLAENLFCIIFMGELFLRVRTHGMNFFFQAMNLVDALLVMLAVIDTYVLTFVTKGSGGLRAISALRVFRLARLIQFVKSSPAFKEIWLIVASFGHSVKALAWVGMLMFFLLYMCAILMTMYIGQNDAVYGELPDPPEEPWQYKTYFGTIPRSMFTLFQVLTLDSWSDNIVRPVAEKAPFLAILFVFYIFLASFGMLNVVIGIIVENTLFVARQQDELAMKKKEGETSKVLGDIRELFYLSDTDNSNTLSLAEFTAAFESKTVRTKFRQIGLPVNDAVEIFKLMDPMKRGYVFLDDFLSSCSLLIGGAGMAKNVAQIAMQIDTLSRRMDLFNDELQCLESSVENITVSTLDFFTDTLPMLTGLTTKKMRQGADYMAPKA